MRIIKYKKEPHIKKDVSYLYCRAFPKKERPPVHYFFKYIDKRCNQLYAFYEKEEFIGFVLLTLYQKYCYISYLAISKKKRNQGYGSQVLSFVKDKYHDYHIFLMYEEVDPKNKDYDNRQIRQNFYLRNGFQNGSLKVNEFDVIYQSGQVGDFLVTFEDYQHVFIANYCRKVLKYLKRPS